MKFPYRVRRNPKGRRAWRDSSSLVLSAAGLLASAWVLMTKEQQAEVLASLGISPYHLSLVTLILVVLGGLIAKHTSVQRVDSASPVQNDEGPDHGDELEDTNS